VGAVLALLPASTLRSGASRPLLRWLAFYTLALTAAYSIVPYKTPWCALGFLNGMILLAGCGVVALVRAVPTIPLKILTALFMLGATGHLAWQAYRASYVLPADMANPYVYAQTSPGIRQLASNLAQLADASARGRRTPVKVIWKDGYYWPLPWYLRRFEAAEWWTSLPEEPAAPLVLASPEYDIALTEKLDATHLMTGYYEIRPRVLAELWVAMDLWEAHLKRLGRL
jgi:predicted membrane-bound mannosyltransferase